MLGKYLGERVRGLRHPATAAFTKTRLARTVAVYECNGVHDR
jgi:hypothetical protein